MPNKFKLVVLESPYNGDSEEHIKYNVRYAQSCVRDCLLRNEAPVASHLLYTQPNIFNDSNPEERKLGIDAGHAWIFVANYMVVYTDLGVSSGMQQGINVAKSIGLPVFKRSLRWLKWSDYKAYIKSKGYEK